MQFYKFCKSFCIVETENKFGSLFKLTSIRIACTQRPMKELVKGHLLQRLSCGPNTEMVVIRQETCMREDKCFFSHHCWTPHNSRFHHCTIARGLIRIRINPAATVFVDDLRRQHAPFVIIIAQLTFENISRGPCSRHHLVVTCTSGCTYMYAGHAKYKRGLM